MTDESDEVRMVAARSLAAIGDPTAVEALTQALADPSRWTATTVAADLVEMGPSAVPTLIEIAAAAGSDRRGAHEAAVTAVHVLGKIATRAPRPCSSSSSRRRTTSTYEHARRQRSVRSAARWRHRRCATH